MAKGKEDAAVATEEAPGAEPKRLSEFVVMQRIDKLLQGLESPKRESVLAWLWTKYIPSMAGSRPLP